MARVFAAGRAPEWLSTLPGAIAAVNPSDILRVARKYLQPRNVEVAVAGPARLGEELMSLGELQIYTVQRR
jgi:predicted Zn-dependent peptidase